MKETRIVYKEVVDHYRAQYKSWGVWWDIFDRELTVWGCDFWYERSARLAIDRFIANNYKQPPNEDILKIIKYP